MLKHDMVLLCRGKPDTLTVRNKLLRLVQEIKLSSDMMTAEWATGTS